MQSRQRLAEGVLRGLRGSCQSGIDLLGPVRRISGLADDGGWRMGCRVV
jgi:hypothetical protein